MAIEIERRFIVKGLEWRSFIEKHEDYKQGYLTSNTNKWAIRVRIINNKKSFITLKSSKKGIENYEFEYEIPQEDGESMWNLSLHKLTKRRYTVKYNNLNWVVDYFTGSNYSLVLAEIELASINESIKIPSWCSKEITGLTIWSNASLAQWPISVWPIEKRLIEQKPKNLETNGT